MKSSLTVVLLAVLALCGAAPAAAPSAQPAFAFDQVVTMVPAGGNLPLPKDFPTVYSTVSANVAAHGSMPVYQRDQAYGQVLHISVMGRRQRRETPDGANVSILQFDTKLAIDLDMSAHTYTQRPLALDVYGIPAYQSHNVQSEVDSNAQAATNALPDQVISGYTVHGVTSRVLITTGAQAGCTPANTLALVTIFATPALPEPIFTDRMYAAPLDMVVASSLSRLSGCPVRPPATLLQSFPTYPGFMFYRALQVGSSTADLRSAPASGMMATVMMRGNLRPLGPADSGLFEVPPGFKRT